MRLHVRAVPIPEGLYTCIEYAAASKGLMYWRFGDVGVLGLSGQRDEQQARPPQ